MTNDTSSGFLQETWTDKSDKRTMASYSASALITIGLIHISQQHHLKTGRFTKAQIRHTGESIKAMMAFHSCLKPDSPVWATYQLYCRILYLSFYWIDANQNLNLSPSHFGLRRLLQALQTYNCCLWDLISCMFQAMLLTSGQFSGQPVILWAKSDYLHV